ncbi:cupin domain-containing protein [Brevundimonas vesicularis]|uniref:cupin domain-containing protein n=1 Tax=Brevundimonas vesicularis TaxID=41276 RepID=UPI0038D42631
MMLSLAPLAGGGWGKNMATSDLAEPTDLVSAYRLITAEMADWRSILREEIWTAYMGAPLQVEVTLSSGPRVEVIEAGVGTWVTVPAGSWSRLTPLGNWTLAGRIGVPEERLG